MAASRGSCTNSLRRLSSTGLLRRQSRSWHQRSHRREEVRSNTQHSQLITTDDCTIVYHWATVTAGRYGRSCGWFAGWWNCLAWLFGLASTAQIVAAQAVSMYAVQHPDFVTQRWHVFITYLFVVWITGLIVLYLNRALPKIETLGGFTVVSGVLISIIVCAVMPKSNGAPYASTYSIWSDWQNQTGYTSNGFVFMLGMLNGAFSVGTPDVVTHLAEEVPQYVLPGSQPLNRANWP